MAVKGILNPSNVCDIDEDIPLPDAMIQDLMMQVLQLGRFVMMMPSEMVNSGEDEAKPDTRLYANRAVNLPQAQQQQ